MEETGSPSPQGARGTAGSVPCGFRLRHLPGWLAAPGSQSRHSGLSPSEGRLQPEPRSAGRPLSRGCGSDPRSRPGCTGSQLSSGPGQVSLSPSLSLSLSPSLCPNLASVLRPEAPPGCTRAHRVGPWAARGRAWA